MKNEKNRDLEARLERAELLYQVSNVMHSTLVPQEALELIIGEAVRVMRANSGSLVLYNPTNGFLEIQASRGLDERAKKLKLKIGEGITGWVARNRKPARVGDAEKDPRYIPLKSNVKSEMAVPLEVEGELRGVLNVDSEQKNAFSEDDQALLEELSIQAAKVIQHTWLYEQLRLKARLFESLISVSHTINSTFNLNDVLEVIVREACQLMKARMSSLLMVDEEGEWITLRAAHGAGKFYASKPRLSVADSLMGVVLRRQKPMQIQNVQTDSRYQNVEIARQEGLVSLLSVPLRHGEKASGTLNVYTGAPHSFSNEEIRILQALAELSAIAIEKAQLHERIVDAEEQMRQSEKLSALGLLAAEIAHEIRNPLTVMKMLFHSLNLEFPSDDPRSRDCRIVMEKMDHLNKIVEQILTYARNSEPNPSRVNLNEILDDLTLLTRHKLKQQQIELVRQFDPELPPLMVDVRQIEQAFLNLMLNAVEAMPKGGRLTISTRLLPPRKGSPKETTVEVTFQDTGVGMTEEQRKRVFSSLLGSSKASGTGLGLAIVRRIIEAHRGNIQIDSRPRTGTTFSIRLPLRPDATL